MKLRGVTFARGIALAAATNALACAASTSNALDGTGGSSQTSATSSTGQGTGPSSGQATGQGGGTFTTGVSTGGAGNGAPCYSGPNDDADKDGWTVAEGDCNDCDPNVNPGAIDTPATTGPDGSMIPAADNDCDGMVQLDATCDGSLTIGDTDPVHGANAIELCQTATSQDKKWGVLSASYVRADGTPYSPGNEVGLLKAFGPNVSVQAGTRMLVLSTGHARTPGETGACGKISCSNNGAGVAPSGFPQNVPNCTPDTHIVDDEGLELQIRAPTNATGYSFAFKFYSFEYPTWACTTYNDQYVTLVKPAPMDSINGNISFDSKHNPVSVNLAFFEVCDPASLPNFASGCYSQGGANCPAPPNPYCPSGLAELEGTGFDVWGGSTVKNGGATTWLQTTAPVQGGSTFTIRFAIWDTGNSQYDSTVLIDNFKWVATGGTVSVATTPIPK